MNKKHYQQKAKAHEKAYLAAVEACDTKAMKYHEQEYLTYKKASESCKI